MMQRMRSNPLALILCVAFTLRLGWALFSPALPVSDFGTFHVLALRLVDGQGYVTEEGLPSAFRPPGYPTFLAVIYWVTHKSLLAAKLANVVLTTITCWLTYLLAHKTFNERVALTGALIVALFPSQILYTSLLATENLFTPLLLASTLFFLKFLQEERRLYLPVAGLLLGLSSLARPISLLTPGIWFLFLIWKRYSLGRSLGTIVALSVVVSMTITPWIVRNAKVMHAFIPSATEGGVGFLTGFNTTADGHYKPYAIQWVRRLGPDLDEVEKEDLAFRLAFDFIRQNPHQVLLLAPLNVFHLFRDDVSGVVWNFKETTRPLPRALWYALVVVAQLYYVGVLGLAAISFFRWRDFPANGWYGLLAANLIYRVGFHTIFVGDDRYHHSIMPVLAIFAAYGLLFVYDRWRARSPQAGVA